MRGLTGTDTESDKDTETEGEIDAGSKPPPVYKHGGPHNSTGYGTHTNNSSNEKKVKNIRQARQDHQPQHANMAHVGCETL